MLSRLLIMSINTTFFDCSWTFIKSSKFQLWSGLEGHYASSCQMLCRSVKQLPRCRNFSFFRMSAAAILNFFKFQICNGPNGHEGQTASPCQISLKSLKLAAEIWRFFNFSKWWPPRSILHFWRYKFLIVGRIISVELHHHAKFRGDLTNHCRDSSILDLLRWRLPPSWIF